MTNKIRKLLPYTLLTLILFGLSLFITDYGNNPNYCDQECQAQLSGEVHGIAVMPPGSSRFISSHGWPMHVLSKTIDDDTSTSAYINYSVVAIIVDLLLAALIAWVAIYLFRKFRKTSSR